MYWNKNKKEVLDKNVPESLCTQYKPLAMVIPEDGVDIECPVHGSHRFYGPPPITC